MVLVMPTVVIRTMHIKKKKNWPALLSPHAASSTPTVNIRIQKNPKGATVTEPPPPPLSRLSVFEKILTSTFPSPAARSVFDPDTLTSSAYPFDDSLKIDYASNSPVLDSDGITYNGTCGFFKLVWAE